MPEWVTILVSLVGGTVGGTVLSGVLAERLGRITRRGRARFVHEDLLRLQSTIARIYLQRESADKWGQAAWLLAPLAGPEDQQDVVAHLKDWRFSACAGALGWAEYLRSSHRVSPAPDDDELERMYRRLAEGRVALIGLAKLKYAPHQCERVVSEADRRSDGKSLPVIEAEEAKRGAKRVEEPASFP